MSSQEIMNNSISGNSPLPESHRVLVVDDEPAICFAYRKLLESERFGFDVCDTVEAAIDLLKNNNYFAVVSDVRFSGSDNEDGIYLLSVLQKEQPLAKVILITGYGSDELKKTYNSLGASHYFEKPVKPSMILTLLRALHLVADEQEEIEYYKSLQLANAQVS